MTKSKKYFCQSRISQSCDHVKLTILAMTTFCIFQKMTKSKKYFCQSRISQSCDHVKLTILAMTTFCIFQKMTESKKYFCQSRISQSCDHVKLTILAMTTFCIFTKNDKVQKIFLSKSHQPILRSRKVNHSGNDDFLHFQKKWQKMTKSKKYFCQSRISQSCDHVKLTILAMATFCIFRKNKWQSPKNIFVKVASANLAIT